MGGVGNRISQLENELQFKLFQRNTRNVALTDGGARLLEPARRLLGQAAAVLDVAASIVSGDEGRVRIGFAGASSQRALPLLTGAVRETHPGIELVLQSRTCVYTAFERLVAGDLDLAFVRTPVARPELRHRVVEVEQVLCALPDGHRLADEPSVRLEDLVDGEFVSLPDDRGSKLQQTMYSMCLRAGFQPKIAQVAPDSSTVLALVAAGAGVTITLSSVRPVQSVGIVYKPIEGTGPSHQLAAPPGVATTPPRHCAASSKSGRRRCPPPIYTVSITPNEKLVLDA